jgi:hypothetical protein
LVGKHQADSIWTVPRILDTLSAPLDGH